MMRSSDGTTPLSRGLLLVDILSRAPEPMTVRELSDASKIPRSTVHRLASELVGWGGLVRANGGYQLGMRLFELGGRVPQQRRLHEVARPIMEDLYEATKRLVQIGVLDGSEVLYLSRVGRQGHQAVAAGVAERLPASCTAMGKALLAFNREAIRAVFARELVRRTRYSITEPQVLRSDLRQVRRAGAAVEREEARLGLVCVAAPIFRPSGAEAAISVTGPAGIFEPDEARAAVRAAALGIARALDGAGL